jgi:hypothetical protein
MHTTFFLLVSAQRVWDIQGGFDEIGCGDNLEKKRKRRQAVPAKTFFTRVSDVRPSLALLRSRFEGCP